MKLLSGHKNYLIKLYLKNFFIVTLIFSSLVFVLNVLEEISFFNNLNLGIYYPLLFTFLNVPSIIFQIFPFIFLITTQFFFINLFNKNELILLKNYGVTNLDIIKIIATDPLAEADFEHYCDQSNYEYLSCKKIKDKIVIRYKFKIKN